jgi:ketosteroid isomerase-like protein
MAEDPATRTSRELVQHYWQTMNSGDSVAIRSFIEQNFAADVEWTVVGTGVPGSGTLKGRDQLLQFMAGLRELFDPGSPRGSVIRLLADGQWAAAETEASGRMRDGRSYRNRYAFFIEVSDREIRAVREYFDTHYVNTLFGGDAASQGGI